MPELSPIIEESFQQYSGAVLQSRALVDVRDGMKPSARQIFYCMDTDKFTYDKPFRKTLKAIGSAMRMYIHGDSSCEGVIMRSGQPFAMRYPLVEVEGSYGNLIESGNWAAPRYTAARLSKIADSLFADIEKNTIADWRDNYDDTEQYPAVLPSKGYYNICNGTFGIGVGLSSSIPQFNIVEVNEALKKLLLNPNIDDDELICIPDFATGAYLLNAAEVRESLKHGSGKACQLRAVIEYDVKDNCLVVTEIPFGVYTNTICGELEAILSSDDNPGIERFNDLTGKTPNIKIYLVKGANPDSVLRYLYKNTSLQYWYAINLTMLDNGHYPRVYTWKAALQAHIDHEKIVYRKGFEYDLQKAEDRLHIVEGILIALANIEEVIQVIKASDSTQAANKALQTNFNLDEVQAKAALDIKLSRLAHLEVEKFEKEAESLRKLIAQLNEILTSETLFNQQLINGWDATSKQFGDKRRTQILTGGEAVTEEIKTAPLVNLILNNGQMLVLEPFDKYNLAKKGSPYIKQNVVCGYKTTSTSTSYLFDGAGRIYKIDNKQLNVGVLNSLSESNIVCAISDFTKPYLVTLTKKGIIKRSDISEYSKCNRAAQAVKVRDGDSLIGAWCADDNDYIYIVDACHKVIKFSVNSISVTGRATIGVKATENEVLSAAVGREEELYLMVADGKGKYTMGNDFTTTGRPSRGQAVADNTTLIAKVEHDIYIVEKGTKLTRYTDKGLAIKGKTAIGAKIADEQIVKAIN